MKPEVVNPSALSRENLNELILLTEELSHNIATFHVVTQMFPQVFAHVAQVGEDPRRVLSPRKSESDWWRFQEADEEAAHFVVENSTTRDGDAFIEAMREYDDRKIVVHFNGGGGMGGTALPIARFLRTVDSEAIVTSAPSSGCIMAAGCRRVGILQGGTMMIHAPKVIVKEYTLLGLRREIQAVEHIHADIAEIFRGRNVDDATIEKWLNSVDDIPFDASAAFAAKLADYIVDVPSATVAGTAPVLPVFAQEALLADRLLNDAIALLRIIPVDRQKLAETLAHHFPFPGLSPGSGPGLVAGSSAQ